MEILFLLVPVSFIFIVLALKVFFWAVNDGQFDDLDGAAHSILFDDDNEENKENQSHAVADESSILNDDKQHD